MRAILVPVLLCLALAACGTEQLMGSAYGTAKASCQMHAEQCTVFPDPH